MLLAHFTLSETLDNAYGVVENEGFIDQGQALMVKTQIDMAMEAAQRDMYTELCGLGLAIPGIDPYNTDGGRPYTALYVGQWQRDGGLDCATEWCEAYKGQGVHVGLVIEGKPSGPRYHQAGMDGVQDDDFDQVVVETFIKHLRPAVRQMVPGYQVHASAAYCVTDWAFYETQSALYQAPHEDVTA